MGRQINENQKVQKEQKRSNRKLKSQLSQQEEALRLKEEEQQKKLRAVRKSVSEGGLIKTVSAQAQIVFNDNVKMSPERSPDKIMTRRQSNKRSYEEELQTATNVRSRLA